MANILGHDGMWKTQTVNGKKIIGLCGYSKLPSFECSG